MEENKSSTLLSTVAIIITVGAVVYFASKGKGRLNSIPTNGNNTGTATPAVAPTHTLMGDTSNYAIIEAINNGQIPSPPQATGWYWNGSEWYPIGQSTTVTSSQYIPTLNNGSQVPATWLFKAPLTISGNTAQGVPVVHTYNTGNTVQAVYNSGATPITPPPAGTPNMGSSLTWSDSFGNFMLAGDTNIDTYLIPPII